MRGLEHKLDYDKPDSDAQTTEIIKTVAQTMANSRSILERKDAIYALLKLFETKDPKLLHMITEATKEQVEIMTRHDTLIESLILMGHLKETEANELRLYKDIMHDSFALHSISKSRKSRNEVVSILSMAGDSVRSIADKLAGKSK